MESQLSEQKTLHPGSMSEHEFAEFSLSLCPSQSTDLLAVRLYSQALAQLEGKDKEGIVPIGRLACILPSLPPSLPLSLSLSLEKRICYVHVLLHVYRLPLPYYYYYMYIIGKALIRASNIFPSKMMHKLMTVCMQCLR